jgi:pyrrolidone-carboxylate peptidase
MSQQMKQKQPRIWVYGFEPFLHYTENITQKVILHLQNDKDLSSIRFDVLPVRFEPEIFSRPVESFAPELVLGMGQYPRGQKIRIERKAYNWQQDKRQDPTLAKPIIKDSPETLSPNWLIKPNPMSWRSYDAGRYVCNYSMYQLTHLAQRHHFNYAFIHIPKDFSLQPAVRFVKDCLTNQGFRS